MDIEKILYIAEERLPQKRALILGLFLILGSIVTINNLVTDFANFIGYPIRPFLYSLLLILWIGYWGFNRFYLPKNKKESIGIVIAIYSENKKERQKLKADFISKLKNDFKQEGMLDFSNIIFLKNHFAQEINESNNPQKKLEKINKKVRGHFYIWGNVKKRTDGDKGEKYFINFQGYVVHKPISQVLSREISIDFSKVLPREVNFLENRSFKGFEASAQIVHLAAKYIIGIAAFVSNDPLLALKLHDGLREKFNVFRPLPLHLQDIRNRIPILISDESIWIAKWHLKENRTDMARNFLKKSILENENNYGAWLFKAVFDFTVDNNVNEAIRSISKAKKYAKNNFEWLYNEAFLHFWNENYSKALKICRTIKKHRYQNEELTISEVREFNLNLLKEENPPAQLYFWIGYLSYFKERNLGNALEDFERFEELATSNMEALKQKSSAYLVDIKKQMGIVK